MMIDHAEIRACSDYRREDCKGPVEVRYSYGVYAGRYCEFHAKHNYRDGCGLIDDEQGSPQDLDEPYGEEDY